MIKGVISSIEGENITVRVQCASACMHCKQKTVCPIETIKKEATIKVKESHKHFVGETVTLALSKSNMILCLIVAYGIPLALILASLAISTWLGCSEKIAGIVALTSILPYYLILFFLNSKLKK